MKHRSLVAMVGFVMLLAQGVAFGEPGRSVAAPSHASLMKINLFMAAGDYRRAVEACQKAIDEAPSAANYIHLTYVYHAIDAYLEFLSQEERWMAVEHLYVNLASRDTEDLVDPPGGLTRIAKEMIQTGVRQQSDVSAAMANRLDRSESNRLWVEQANWRTTNPKTWWQGMPQEWVH